MAKRFTDSRKWNDPWFRKLPSSYRWLWLYILDCCSHIGIWKVDMDLASFNIGEDVILEEAVGIFNGRIISLPGDKWFVPKFILFQYGVLSEEGRLHNKIIRDLEVALPKPVYDEYIRVTGCQQGDNTLKAKDKVSSNLLSSNLLTDIVDYWNTTTLSKVKSITNERKKKLKDRLKSAHFRENWKASIDCMAKSKFCLGQVSGKTWKATLDFFIANDTNYVKALEGKYDDDKEIKWDKY